MWIKGNPFIIGEVLSYAHTYMHVQLILSHQGQLFHMETENIVKDVTENNLLQYVLLYMLLFSFIGFLFCAWKVMWK